MMIHDVRGIGSWFFWSTGDVNRESESFNTDCKVKRVSASLLQKRKKPAGYVSQGRTFSPLRLLFWASLIVRARTQQVGSFPAVVELSSLNGTNGFCIIGEAAVDQSGRAVASAGDFNGDGIDDILIGAEYADPSGRDDAGKSYVVFGRGSVVRGGALELANLDGTNGFSINGEVVGDFSGASVSSAKDLNGDGIDDIIIGAYYANPPGKLFAGKSYVVFGSRSMVSGGTLELATLFGNKGFKINGETAVDQSGWSVSSAGDVNGDGIDDLLIGASEASPSSRLLAGKSYVVFGNRSVVSGGVFDLATLDGTNGFRINGEVIDDLSGYSVSAAGDVNSDGIDDIIIGARQADPSGRSQAGKSYVVFGSRSGVSGGTLELANLDGTNGFSINGEASYIWSGYSVSAAGDVNADGIDDILIGAPHADPSGRLDAGKSYVVFGNRSVISGGTLDLANLDGTNGFSIDGEMKADNSGISVSAAGDLNGDSIDDILIGAPHANPSGRSAAGKSYVIFGSRSSVGGGRLELASLDGNNGFRINGEAVNDLSGWSVSSAGDVNADGIADILIGARGSSPSGKILAGKSYVIFGVGQPPTTSMTTQAQTKTAVPTTTSAASATVALTTSTSTQAQTTTAAPATTSAASATVALKTSTSTQTQTTTTPTAYRSTSHMVQTLSPSSLRTTPLPTTVLNIPRTGSPSDSSESLIVGLIIGIAALGSSILVGGAFYLKGIVQNKKTKGEIPLEDKNDSTTNYESRDTDISRSISSNSKDHSGNQLNSEERYCPVPVRGKADDKIIHSQPKHSDSLDPADSNSHDSEEADQTPIQPRAQFRKEPTYEELTLIPPKPEYRDFPSDHHNHDQRPPVLTKNISSSSECSSECNSAEYYP